MAEDAEKANTLSREADTIYQQFNVTGEYTRSGDEKSLLIPSNQGGKPKGGAVEVEVRKRHRGPG